MKKCEKTTYNTHKYYNYMNNVHKMRLMLDKSIGGCKIKRENQKKLRGVQR